MKRVETISEAINILITATQIGYAKNCFNMQESWQIQEAINFFQDLAQKFPQDESTESPDGKAANIVEQSTILRQSEK